MAPADAVNRSSMIAAGFWSTWNEPSQVYLSCEFRVAVWVPLPPSVTSMTMPARASAKVAAALMTAADDGIT